MKIKLIRYGSTPLGTFGELHIGNEIFRTVERPWLNNAPRISCVPVGQYKLEPHDSDAHPNVWALVNHSLGVYHYADPKAKRTSILIHTANTADQLEGCIAPGTDFGIPLSTWGVINSQVALNRIRTLLAGETDISLEIVWQRHGDREH